MLLKLTRNKFTNLKNNFFFFISGQSSKGFPDLSQFLDFFKVSVNMSLSLTQVF